MCNFYILKFMFSLQIATQEIGIKHKNFKYIYILIIYTLKGTINFNLALCKRWYCKQRIISLNQRNGFFLLFANINV